MCHQADAFEDNNNNDVCNVESNNNQHTPHEERTVPASNVTRGSEGLPDHTQHDAFYNND